MSQKGLRATLAGNARAVVLLAVEQGAHEAPNISKDAAALVSNALSVNEFLVDAETASISLVCREARETEECQCAVARPLRRQEISMMLAAMTIDEVDPPFGESLEGVYSVGIKDVIDDAGNHFDVLHR